VCEVQLTLTDFIKAKSNGGHAMYKLLRLIGRLDPAFSVYQGLASHTVDVSRLADGECSPPPLSVHLTLQCVMIHGVVSADIPSSSRTVPCRSPPQVLFLRGPMPVRVPSACRRTLYQHYKPRDAS
jgi:hypothetical protein